MPQPVAPPIHRQWQAHKPLNHHTQDLTLESGVRISTPLYVDLTQVQRKELLNAVREECAKLEESTSSASQSGISVVSYNTKQPAIESYIGMAVDVLRTMIFQRGGIAIDLLLRLQSVTGIEYITDKDIAAAQKSKLAAVKSYISENAYAA